MRKLLNKRRKPLNKRIIALGAGWQGVDKSVVEHYAAKAGRSPWKPLINTDQGDLLLFVFLLAGVLGGFILGYYWRILFGKNQGSGDTSEKS